jgi:hypothetical protein
LGVGGLVFAEELEGVVFVLEVADVAVTAHMISLAQPRPKPVPQPSKA